MISATELFGGELLPLALNTIIDIEISPHKSLDIPWLFGGELLPLVQTR